MGLNRVSVIFKLAAFHKFDTITLFQAILGLKTHGSQ